jgi:hypothetical protein
MIDRLLSLSHQSITNERDYQDLFLFTILSLIPSTMLNKYSQFSLFVYFIKSQQTLNYQH